jgi:predicted ATPase
VELGDLFIECSKNRSFLIETHSEHLILRLLKRIRQASDKELPESFDPILDGDISIVYLESTTNGVVAKRIRVDEDGEFIDRWPKGFFSERAEELF